VLVTLEIDKESKFLIWLDVFLLISIVTGSIIYELARDFMSPDIAVYYGLSIGVGVLIGMLMLKKRKKKMLESRGKNLQ